MAALFAPARLSLAGGDEDIYTLDPEDLYDTSSDTTKHDYPRHPLRRDAGIVTSLTLGSWKWQGGGGSLFSVSVPEKTAGARPGAIASRFRNREYRSLAEPTVTMMAVVSEENIAPDTDTVPSSPPGLSYSKSSKSSDSSCRSSSLSDLESTDKLSNYEDIAIEETGRSSDDDSNLKPEDRPTLKRQVPRSASTGAVKTLSSPPMGKRAPYPSLKGAVNGVLRDQSLNLPNGRMMRRGFSSPSSPQCTMQSPNRITSRSPSPSKRSWTNGYSSSPRSFGSTTPRASLEPKSPGFGGPLRRTETWQPGRRKSIKELEAEYDDNDEEVPDEAILENVPVSPMPGQSRTLTPSKSPSPSPHRTPSYGNLHSANVPRKAKRPSAPTMLANGQRAPRSPRNTRPYMLPHSISTPSLHGDPFRRQQRSKSWAEDLSDEAKHLSAALEEYAERVSVEKHGSGPNSTPNSPPRPNFAAKRSKTSITDLPPLQKGHMMIDPLPISKEKEAVLSRTRPSWLPPKSQKEERRHLREWEQMMAKAAEAEKKRQSREKEQLEERKEQQDSIDRVWDQHVLPNWDTVIHEPRTRELWWRGVTPRSRGLVWQKALGNELGLSAASYDAALNRARDLEERLGDASAAEGEMSKEAAWFDAIERDVPSAFKNTDAPPELRDALTDVLKAYAMYRSDVGYVYGTHLPAAILCQHMRPADAFVALANMLNRPLPLAFLVHDQPAMARAYDLVLSTLKYKFSKLHGHLTSSAVDLRPEDYLDPVFRCLFAYSLPAEHACRVWDIFAFEGDKALVRAAVAVLGRLESKLYGSKEEILDVVGWRNDALWDLGTEEEFVKAVRDAGKVDAKGEVGN